MDMVLAVVTSDLSELGESGHWLRDVFLSAWWVLVLSE